ncbi:MAG: hypothetical protein BGO70_13030 [Bacteroidetes bacterium 43-93]|nr:hypothetical protein [Bacteroidota bacterium]OJW99363.1 MAG: hypothetical protein BGO70_13030 [Bacteroidetes bacterium 43-93]
MEKNCLIIDNEDQTSSIETIRREGKMQKVSINCRQFNVGSTERDDLLSNGKIDLDKVFAAFQQEFSGIHFNLIAFDWDLNDDSINGVDLIRLFQNKGIRANTPKLLYSGVLKDEIHRILDVYRENNNFSTAWKPISTLIKIKIEDFIDREEYERSIVNLVKRNGESIESIFSAKLREYSTLIFKNMYPNFEGKSLAEIADILDKDKPQGSKFMHELIEQSLAYMIKLNDE